MVTLTEVEKAYVLSQEAYQLSQNEYVKDQELWHSNLANEKEVLILQKEAAELAIRYYKTQLGEVV